MIRTTFFMLFSLLFTLSHLALAQNNNNRFVNRSEQQWVQYYADYSFNDNWKGIIDAGFRWRNNFADPTQHLIRGGLSRRMGNHFSISFAVGHFGVYQGNRVADTEIRPHQQITYHHAFGTLKLTHRIRIEERFLNLQSGRSMSMRYRYMMMVRLFELPISPSDPSFKFIFNIGNEVFISSGDDALPTAFFQNRILLSPTIQFSERLKVNVTWNNQFAATSDREVFNQMDVLWIQIRHRLR